MKYFSHSAVYYVTPAGYCCAPHLWFLLVVIKSNLILPRISLINRPVFISAATPDSCPGCLFALGALWLARLMCKLERDLQCYSVGCMLNSCVAAQCCGVAQQMSACVRDIGGKSPAKRPLNCGSLGCGDEKALLDSGRRS